MKKSYDEILKTFSNNLKRLRRVRGLTQEDMTDFDFNYRFYQRLESGTYSPNLKTLYKLAKSFEVNIEDLLKFSK